MKFLINNCIMFNEETSTIEDSSGKAMPVVLSSTQCRVLSLLVKNNNQLLTKNFILSHVWEEYGKSSSYGNLNNYISMIRKIFNAMGMNDIIVTLPKQGYVFSASEVSVIEDTRLVAEHSVQSVVSKKLVSVNLIKLMLTIFVIGSAIVIFLEQFYLFYSDVLYITGDGNLKMSDALCYDESNIH